MSKEHFKCPWCSQAFFGIVRYCCNLPECDNCGCRICHSKKGSQELQEQYRKDLISCVNCNQPANKRQEYFLLGNCQEYYCHKCLMIFYINYCKMLQQYEQNFGDIIYIQVELKCGCEVQRSVIVDFLRKYCALCGLKNEGQRCIELANQCKVMLSCCNNFYQDTNNQIYRKQNRNKITQLCFNIFQEIVQCEDYKSIIEENNIGMKIKGKFKCKDCLKDHQKKSMRQYEIRKDRCNKCKSYIQFPCNQFSTLCKVCKGKKLFMKKCDKCLKPFISINLIKGPQWKTKVYCQYCNQQEKGGKNEKKLQYYMGIPKQIRTNIKPQMNERVEHKRLKFKYIEKQQDQKDEKKKRNNDFNALECKLCFNTESTMMNKVCRHLMMCEQCFKVYSRKFQGAERLACPLCNTIGEYFTYISPIFS